MPWQSNQQRKWGHTASGASKGLKLPRKVKPVKTVKTVSLKSLLRMK